MPAKRFLLLFSDTGGGHRAGAQAVAQALHQAYGDAVHVILVDALVFSRKWPFHRFPAWYPYMVRGRAWGWKMGFRLTDRAAAVEILTRLAYPYVRPALHALFEAYPADVVVSFHALLNRLLGLGVREARPPVATATVILDMISAHALWFGRGLDRYFLPQEALAARAKALGISPETLVVAGMPVRGEMVEAAKMPQARARNLLGLNEDGRVVLVVGGGDGMGPMADVVKAILQRDLPAQIVTIAGRNDLLRQRLRSLTPTSSLRIEGFTQEMHLWLRAADILVTKAGPNTLAEAFVMGLPTVLYAAIPGQEEGNVRLVEGHGAGVWAPHPQRAADAVASLLKDEEGRRAMGRRARELATPHAAETIARELYNLAMTKHG